MYFDQAQFGKRLKELRRLQGMTQEKMAEIFHCTEDHVGRMERGREGCSIDLLVEIAVYFNVSTDYLLMGKGSDRVDEWSEKQLMCRKFILYERNCSDII